MDTTTETSQNKNKNKTKTEAKAKAKANKNQSKSKTEIPQKQTSRSARSKRRRSPNLINAATLQAPKKFRGKNFQWEVQHARSIAFKVLYNGGGYRGNTFNKESFSVESCLLSAMIGVSLAPNMDSLAISRCGRTDASVSASYQVYGAVVRCRATSGIGVWPRGIFASGKSPHDLIHEDDASYWYKPAHDPFLDSREEFTLPPDSDQEFDYLAQINSKLPISIRVVGWAAVPHNWHARFSCHSRAYRYYFLKDVLNPELIQPAAAKLQGDHDFRNFCKYNPAVSRYLRTLEQVSIHHASVPITVDKPISNQDPVDTLYYLYIRGMGFLWHQVRAIVSVLFHVALGLEKSSIIDELLDPSVYSSRPVYPFAEPNSLVLWDVVYKPALKFGSTSPMYKRADAVRALTKYWYNFKIQTQIAADFVKSAADAAGIGNPDDLQSVLEVYANHDVAWRKSLNLDLAVTKHVPFINRERAKEFQVPKPDMPHPPDAVIVPSDYSANVLTKLMETAKPAENDSEPSSSLNKT